MLQAHIYISGFVQAVGFREFIRSRAKNLGLTGWVKNLPDGRVEALVQSPKGPEEEDQEKIEEIVRYCNIGPFSAEIEEVEYDYEDPEENFNDFEAL